jgi:hypothetical protein
MFRAQRATEANFKLQPQARLIHSFYHRNYRQ